MKYGKLFLVMLLALVFTLPVVLADEDAEVSPEDVEEVSEMQTPLGAEIRLLQLEKAINRNIIAGNEIIASIIEDNESADVSDLEDIIVEMESLLTEVQDMTFEGDARELAHSYVEIKSRARALTKSFRESSKDYLDDENLEPVRERVRNKYQEKMQDYDEKISQKRNEYNGGKLSVLLQRLGVTDERMVDGVRNGTLTVGQVRSEIVNKLKGLSTGGKEQAALKIREGKIKGEVFKKVLIERIKVMTEGLDGNAGVNKGGKNIDPDTLGKGGGKK